MPTCIGLKKGIEAHQRIINPSKDEQPDITDHCR
jgi:hypothetical protein